MNYIGKQVFRFVPLKFFETKGLIPDCDDDVMDEVHVLPGVYLTSPTYFPRHLTAKMEFLLLVAFARIRQAPSRTGG